ncbi:MAG: hypothetical protein ABEJ03_00580 [Candidatus Nanohaloarchaea archaeon]
MAHEKIEQWIEQKLEEGVDRKRLRKILKESGRDPALVDRVEDPFDSEDEVEEEEPAHEAQDVPEEQESAFGDISLPQLSLPEVAAPGFGNIVHGHRFKISVAAVLAVVMVFGGVTMFEPDEKPRTREEIRAAAEKGCPDIGVRINSVSFGSTPEVSAEVTGGPASVVIELYDGEELSDKVYARFNGEKTVEMSSGGNRAIIRPVGCYRLQDEVALS